MVYRMSRFGLQRVHAAWAGWCLGAVSCLALPAGSVSAQTPSAPSDTAQSTLERANADQVQATTQALLDALVDSGVMTRGRTEALLSAAKAKAAAMVPFAGPDGSTVVVPPAPTPYVPEAVQAQAQARGAGLTAPSVAVPSAGHAATQGLNPLGKKALGKPHVSANAKSHRVLPKGKKSPTHQKSKKK
jgi:hypothetical protein